MEYGVEEIFKKRMIMWELSGACEACNRLFLQVVFRRDVTPWQGCVQWRCEPSWQGREYGVWR